MKNRLLISSSLVLMLVVPAARAVPPVFTLQTGVGTDDVSGESDSFFHVTGNVLYSQGISRNSIVNFTAELSSYHYQEIDDSSAEKLFLEAEYSYTPRAGFSVPTYSAAIRQLEEYKDNSDLDASTTSILLSIGYRIDDQSSVLGGLRLREKSSKNDTSETGYFINFDYAPDNKWLLYTTLIIADEETTVSANTASRLASKSHLPGEPGFVGSIPSTTSDITSDSDNTWITVGASYGLDSNSSIDMAVNNQTYDTDSGKTSGNVITFDYFYRF